MARHRKSTFCVVLFAGVLLTTTAWAQLPRNVILLIGDGMGFEQVKAASIYATGTEDGLVMQTLPYQAEMTTYSANASITDSAASATAMATGHKVNNGVVSLAIPGDGSELETSLQWHKARGRSVGLVTTTFMTHGTPAPFGAHNIDRNHTDEIAWDYLNKTRPHVLLGGGGYGLSPTAATAAGYHVVTTRSNLLALDTEDPLLTHLSGQFGSTHLPYEYDGTWGDLPHLTDMVVTALAVLDNNPDGFFLMIEGGRIDHACHANHLPRSIYETLEFDDALQLVLDWAEERNDTLIIVTSDHETGGLSVVQNNGAGNWPDVTWSTTGHTAWKVPIYADGPNAHYVSGVLDNTDIFALTTDPRPTLVVAPSVINKYVRYAESLPSYVDSFTLSRDGIGTHDYTITTDAPWLDVDPDAGILAGQTDTISLLYNDIATMPIGMYEATITVESMTAGNSPQTVTVNVVIAAAPGDFDGDGDVDQDDFGVFQRCLGVTDFAAMPECAWADLNNDGRVNQADRTLWTDCVSGPGIAADLYCIP